MTDQRDPNWDPPQPAQVPCEYCVNGQITSHMGYNQQTHQQEAVNVTCGWCSGTGSRQA